MKTSGVVGSLVVVLGLQGCGGTAFVLPPVPDDEVSLAVDEINADPDLHSFPRGAAYYRQAMERIEARLLQKVGPVCTVAETSDCHFHFHYVADDEVNAVTMEDGQIYLHRGILDYLESDDEIAGVMAHEMGHQIAGHVEETKGSAVLGTVLGGLLMGAAAVAGGSTPERADDLTNEGMALGAHVGIISFSKEQEREADLLAAYLLARGSFDLRRAGGVFVVLSKLGDKSWASWRDTHPAGPERIVAWRKAVTEVEASSTLLPRRTEP